MKRGLYLILIILASNLVLAGDVDLTYDIIKGDLLIGEEPSYMLHFVNNGGSEEPILIKSIDLNWILKQDGETYIVDKYSSLDIPIEYEQLGENLERKEQGINLIIEVGADRYEKVMPVNLIDYTKLVNLEFFALPILDSRTTSNIQIKVINPYNVELKELNLRIKSDGIFSSEQTIDLGKKETKLLDFMIDLDDQLLNGEYIAQIIVSYNQNDVIKNDFTITVQEYNELKRVPDIKEEFLKNIVKITYKNEGNKNINDIHKEEFSFMASKFTDFKTAPATYENYIAIWNLELKPGDSYTIEYTTNYRIPAIIFILIIICAYLIYYYTYKPLRITKSVLSLKGASDKYKKLKVKIKIKNISNKNLDDITVTETIPGTNRMPTIEKGGYPRYTGNKGENFMITWNFSLRKNEERVIIYTINEEMNISKARLIFSPARVKCTYNGKQYQTTSRKIGL